MKTCEQCAYFEKNEFDYDKCHCSWFNEEVSNITDACDDFERKLTATEERARAYTDDTEKAIKECYGVSDCDAQFNAELAYNAYLRSAENFMELPLSERLTEEEKEKIRKEWTDAHAPGWYAKPYLRGRFRVLQDIFGRDFFQKGGRE